MRLSMAATMALPSVFWAPAFATTTSHLADLCTVAYVQSVLPPSGLITGISPSSTSVTANAVTNYTATAGNTNPSKVGLDFCNITFSYSHAGLNDRVIALETPTNPFTLTVPRSTSGSGSPPRRNSKAASSPPVAVAWLSRRARMR